jgi:hypothetical protein
MDVSFSVDRNRSGYLRLLPDIKLNDVSGTDTILGRWHHGVLFFLCAQGLAAREDAYQERGGEANPKGLRFEHGGFSLL